MIETTTPVADGMLRFVRYGFMANRLTYCGPVGEDRTLFDYAVECVTDDGLASLLRRFSGAFPYLQLIARSNGFSNPFDQRVVEAYWIGNELLERVEVRQPRNRCSGGRHSNAGRTCHRHRLMGS